MKIWITGIAGFLGGHLADTLSGLGHAVAGNDNVLCASHPHQYGSYIDCCDFNGMRGAFECFRPDVVYHCAATAHEGLSNFSPSFITKNIYEASVATFSAAIATGVKRIIYMSSMARYGRELPPFEESLRPAPIDPYGIAKVAAEDTLKALCRLHNVEYVIAVPHNIIGTGQRYWDPYRNVASIMINRALQGKSLIIYGDGNQRRSFSPVADCLHSLVQMINAPISGHVINIGPDGGDISVLELAEMIRDLTGGTAEMQHVAARPNETATAHCSSSKARKLLGFQPQVSLEECLKQMISYISFRGTRQFDYSFPLEIMTDKTPKTWTERMI